MTKSIKYQLRASDNVINHDFQNPVQILSKAP